MKPDTVLSVKDMHTVFATPGGTAHAIRGVSFDLRRGERLGIVGESGAGKSALVLSLLGLVEPPGRVAGGSVWLNGRDLRTLSERQMRRVRGKEISIVFQDPLTALNPVRRIGPQVAEVLLMHGDLSRKQARERAVGLLADVELPEPEKCYAAYPHELSGGMRQRVMIAIALANSPDVLIADEPTTALDATTQAQIITLLNKVIEERGTAVVMITHNMGLVADFCDTVQVMYAGEVVEYGSRDRLLDRPAHPYTAALLASVPAMDARRDLPLPALSGLPPSLTDLPEGCAFAPRCPLEGERGLCRTTRPAPRILDGEPDRMSMCHFSAEQLALTS
ncbi:ABC transporter ATP-binding protein [Sinosporangium siamense]|uniref:Oligopeptide ABC transporter ATP-binding protein OppD n=1 Tax=Sinosporangium siamense TaxID=1367973 RepID=A0A919RK99_9ACTN|nr:ABC transporter ATP-binding protein [Sinosporangium siamense]GII95338.1 oligopeptide ABC transporter ATP-binding protein OppD [Sinosporangium siamense]